MSSHLTTAAAQSVLADGRLPEPKAIWDYFLAMVETPRGSGFPDLPREKIIGFGKELGLETERDEAGNVIIRKPATPGYESRPSVCLQAHYDMVTVAAEGLTFDFTKQPLVPRIVESPDKAFGQYALMATDTSLGADNGIGCGIVLAILADKTLKHGPIEGLFTTDEETTMYGATNIKKGFIKSPYLINVDSEEDWRITIGCAGGFEDELTLPLKKDNIEGAAIRIELKGLQGGHSGVEIHKGRANALKLLGQLIHQTTLHCNLEGKFGLQYFVGGDKRNVIPPNARCGIVVPAASKAEFMTELKKQEELLKQEWKTIEKDMKFIETEGAIDKHVSYDYESTRKFLDVVLIAPHGVMRMSPDVEGLVETSINFCKAVLCDKPECHAARFEFFPRSSDNDYMPVVHEQLKALARTVGANITDMPNIFPGWLPDTANPLLTLSVETYKEIHGKEPEIYAIHAGLECGMFQASHPGLKCISVGPYMVDVHSPKETLFIDTVPGSYKLLTTVLEKIH
eukprot:MONOS_6123.1-p1 / transcript=MONOS_6123.1 / gene=MONOS_6123 / organism=Monocercomonoides_exilis_PA203 / gene_product=aminoacyl-histidine dipeptidase / transcript_product=aminoacyl-histidine dipeptidase / location=Mono_scaffold00188:90245-91843(-) / protein_length=512 / sequence_SO=supercontig / SO=protein_coding / is_pseudo=false